MGFDLNPRSKILTPEPTGYVAWKFSESHLWCQKVRVRSWQQQGGPY